MVFGYVRFKVNRRHQRRLNLIGSLHKVKTNTVRVKNLSIPRNSAFFRDLLGSLFEAKHRSEPDPTCNDDVIVIQQALARLSPNLRTAFLLTEVEGLTTEEASAAIGIPAGTVKSRCHHAKKRLREILGPTYPEVSNYVQPIPD